MSDGEDSAVRTARQKLARLDQVEAELRAEQARAQTELADAKVTAARAVLSARLAGSEPPTDTTARVAQLSAELEANAGALAQIPARRQALDGELFSARAAAERKRVDVLLEEAERRQVKTRGLLAQLKAHEGCDYAPAFLDRPLVTIGPDGSARYVTPVPKTEELRQEAGNAQQMALVYAQEATRLKNAAAAAGVDESSGGV